MSKTNPNGIYHTYINGHPEELCIVGDGWHQLNLFREIEQYAKSHKMVVNYATMPAHEKSRQQDILSANSDKYEIVAFKAHIPGVTNILFAPKYRVQIHNKRTNQTQAYMGTMAHFMFDMLNNLRGIQK